MLLLHRPFSWRQNQLLHVETASVAAGSCMGNSQLFSPMLPRAHKSILAFNELLPPHYPHCSCIWGLVQPPLFYPSCRGELFLLPQPIQRRDITSEAAPMLRLQPGVCTGGSLFQGNHLPGRYLPQLYCVHLPSPTSLVCSHKCKANAFAQTAASGSLLVIGLARTPRRDRPCKIPHAVWYSAFIWLCLLVLFACK